MMREITLLPDCPVAADGDEENLSSDVPFFHSIHLAFRIIYTFLSLQGLPCQYLSTNAMPLSK
jgi:hypothetical protein